jgi:hypothetical protein
MKVFVIHRTKMRSAARTAIQAICRTHSIEIEPFFLKRSYGPDWKKQAESEILSAEAVVVYDPEACGTSENTSWEIERATKLGRIPIGLAPGEDNADSVGLLRSAYDFSTEFEECFPDKLKDRGEIIDLYKTMLETSEQLIQRRQVTSGFFITIIGAILGLIGFLFDRKESTESFLLLSLPALLLAALLCRSWHNLLVNYGKLNSAKFKVISKLEKSLGIRMFDAEWIALGKGLRRNKYQSFTTTEASVPKVIMYFFVICCVAALAFVLFPSLLSIGTGPQVP